MTQRDLLELAVLAAGAVVISAFFGLLLLGGILPVYVAIPAQVGGGFVWGVWLAGQTRAHR